MFRERTDTQRFILWLAPIILIAAVFIAYHNSLSNQFVWDDNFLIKNNTTINRPADIKEIFTTHLFYGSEIKSNFYRPLQKLSFILDYSIWHLNPLGYHLTNILLHALVSILVYVLLLNITSNQKISLFSSLIFAIHPIHTEAVTYISGRADSLASLFLLSALILYIKHTNNKKYLFYLVSIFLFILALLSKENTLVFPLLLVLYCAISKTKTNCLINLLPFLLIALIYIILRLTILNFQLAIPPELKTPFLDRLMTSSKVLFLYLAVLIYPSHLHMERQIAISNTIFEPITFIAVIGIISILISAIYFRKHSKIVFFAAAWFVINLIPYSNIIKLNAYVTEHWLYLSSVGFFLLLTSLVDKFMKRIGYCFLSGVILIYGAVTIHQNSFWKDEITLYKRVIECNPNSGRAHLGLGKAYSNLGLYDDALSEFKKVIELRPDYLDMYNELGNVYMNKGEIDLGIEQYKKVLHLKPNHPTAHYNMGRAYEKLGQLDAAKNEYLESLKNDPHYAKASAGLANLYQQLGNDDEVVASYINALRLNPDLLEVYINLGAAYERREMFDYAEEIYARGIQRYPNSAELHYNLGVVYKKQGLYDKAINEYQTAIKLKPDYADAYGNLGVAYAKKGMIEEAKKAIMKSLEIDPSNEIMKQNLMKLEGSRE